MQFIQAQSFAFNRAFLVLKKHDTLGRADQAELADIGARALESWRGFKQSRNPPSADEVDATIQLIFNVLTKGKVPLGL